MGLVAFGGRRIGFWVSDEVHAVAGELPEGTDIRPIGEPVEGGRVLMLHAADDTDRTVWARAVHAPGGASLLCPWGEVLVAGLGPVVRFFDADGTDLGGFRSDAGELVSAWPTEGALLLFGHTTVWCVGADLQVRWRRSFEGDAVLHVRNEPGEVVLALMRGEDWQEMRLSLGTGEG